MLVILATLIFGTTKKLGQDKNIVFKGETSSFKETFIDKEVQLNSINLTKLYEKKLVGNYSKEREEKKRERKISNVMRAKDEVNLDLNVQDMEK